MSKIPTEATPLEQIIHQAFHDIADKYEIDVDLVAKIIKEYDDIMSKQLEASLIFDGN